MLHRLMVSMASRVEHGKEEGIEETWRGTAKEREIRLVTKKERPNCETVFSVFCTFSYFSAISRKQPVVIP